MSPALLSAASAMEAASRYEFVPFAGQAASMVVVPPCAPTELTAVRAAAGLVVVWDRRESPPADDVVRGLKLADAYVTGRSGVVLVAHLNALLSARERDTASRQLTRSDPGEQLRSTGN